ncbi:MAG: hypothetical protein CL477_08135 [Acidobacteria bacterium]|nr:hypothetical protein [Acidobacteriota bacterium]
MTGRGYQTTTCVCGRPLIIRAEHQSYGRGSTWQLVPVIIAYADCGAGCVPHLLDRPGRLPVPAQLSLFDQLEASA